MSIRLKNEINALSARVELLERAMNKLNPEPRTVAGAPDPDVKKTKKTKPEGGEA